MEKYTEAELEIIEFEEEDVITGSNDADPPPWLGEVG